MVGFRVAGVWGAISVGVVGAAAQLSTVIANADPGDVGPWITGGGSVATVSALVYMAKKFTEGSIVAVNQAELSRRQAEREDKYLEIIAASQEREDTYRAFLVGRKLGG